MRKRLFQTLLAALLLVGAAACLPTKPEILQPQVAATVAVEARMVPPTQAAAAAAYEFSVSGSYPAPGSGSLLSSSAASLSAPADGLIIKNAEMVLEVADPDAAIIQVSQTVAELEGYILSSEVAVQRFENKPTKYATIVLVVPAANFEAALQQLRALAVIVRSEISTGQEFTGEYVDLEARLTNLKATRDRIRAFLEDAKTVDEALKVNAQLSQVEGEIEQIQGRMNYLSDRAANSTIKVQIVLYNPAVSTPYPTPAPWSPANTFADAAGLLGAGARSFVDGLIYFVVLILPLAAPFVILVWLAGKLRKRLNR